MVISSVMLGISIIGFIVALVLNAFVLDDYDAYGEIPIPGSAPVQLPAGEVTVSFHTQVIGSPSGGGLPVPSLTITIKPPAGVADPEVTESYSGTTTVNNDSRRRVWRIQVPAEGTYQISADGQVNGYINPQLAFGRDKSTGVLVWGFVALFVVALLGLGGGIWGSFRTPRPVALSAPSLATPEHFVTPSREPDGEGIRIEQLRHLAALRDSGALTEAEFQAEKRRILDEI